VTKGINGRLMNSQAGEDARNFNAVFYGIPECETGTTKL